MGPYSGAKLSQKHTLIYGDIFDPHPLLSWFVGLAKQPEKQSFLSELQRSVWEMHSGGLWICCDSADLCTAQCVLTEEIWMCIQYRSEIVLLTQCAQIWSLKIVLKKKIRFKTLRVIFRLTVKCIYGLFFFYMSASVQTLLLTKVGIYTLLWSVL